MKARLEYEFSRPDGIYGRFYFENSPLPMCVFLTHSYEVPEGTGKWLPKTPPGKYTCVRGTHTLGHPGAYHVLETFEITNVPGHHGILFHPGDFNKDSEGCFLLGKSIIKDREWFIVMSKVTFHDWMSIIGNETSFELEVKYADHHQELSN